MAAVRFTVADGQKAANAIDVSLRDVAGLRAKVAAAFKALDQDHSGAIDMTEAKALVRDLCAMMCVAPPSEPEFTTHFAALDADHSGNLSEQEVGSGIQGALIYKLQGLRARLDKAQEQNLQPSDPLP